MSCIWVLSKLGPSLNCFNQVVTEFQNSSGVSSLEHLEHCGFFLGGGGIQNIKSHFILGDLNFYILT